MNILAISGSTRQTSTNTAFIEAIKIAAPKNINISIYRALGDFPIFSADLEGIKTPKIIQDFTEQVRLADGLLISSPEYVHAIPGGLKNAIDWLVSSDAIIAKPVVLAHASHRGDDMLQSLRLVLQTVTNGFNEDLFLRVPLMSKTAEEIKSILNDQNEVLAIQNFLNEFALSARKPA
ncbi:MAG: NADPH-dependent FMN reductase [Pseudomonas marincola]